MLYCSSSITLGEKRVSKLIVIPASFNCYLKWLSRLCSSHIIFHKEAVQAITHAGYHTSSSPALFPLWPTVHPVKRKGWALSPAFHVQTHPRITHLHTHSHTGTGPDFVARRHHLLWEEESEQKTRAKRKAEWSLMREGEGWGWRSGKANHRLRRRAE